MDNANKKLAMALNQFEILCGDSGYDLVTKNNLSYTKNMIDTN
jgi:hypothetical protein